MAWRRTKIRPRVGRNPLTGETIRIIKRPPYSEWTLERLKEQEADILRLLPSSTNDIQTLYNEEATKNHQLQVERQKIADRIADIQKTGRERSRQEHEALGPIKKLFSDWKASSEKLTTAEDAEIKNLGKILLDKFSYNYDKNKYCDDFARLSELQKVRHAISKKGKKNTERAIIAAHQGKSRHLAGKIKAGLKAQISIDPHCPYCGGDIGDDPHCDHIYPVSKGGLSRQENMVYICSSCNMKKSILTLTQFVQKYGLQRIEIEQRLSKLGKDY